MRFDTRLEVAKAVGGSFWCSWAQTRTEAPAGAIAARSVMDWCVSSRPRLSSDRDLHRGLGGQRPKIFFVSLKSTSNFGPLW